MHTYNYNNWNELYHYGTKGQKWGQRRYQNADGTLTPQGRIHYGYGEGRVKNVALAGLGPGFAKARSSEGYLTAYGNKAYRRGLKAQRFQDKFNIFNRDARKAAWKKSKVNKTVKNRLKTDEQYNKKIAEVMDRRRENVRRALPAILGTAIAGGIVSGALNKRGMSAFDDGKDNLAKVLMGSSMAVSLGTLGMQYHIGKKAYKEYTETLRKDIKTKGKSK